MKEKDNSKNVVPFHGVNLSINEAKRLGLSLLLGIIGVIIVLFIFESQTKVTRFFISSAFVLGGYYLIAKKVFPNTKNDN